MLIHAARSWPQIRSHGRRGRKKMGLTELSRTRGSSQLWTYPQILVSHQKFPTLRKTVLSSAPAPQAQARAWNPVPGCASSFAPHQIEYQKGRRWHRERAREFRASCTILWSFVDTLMWCDWCFWVTTINFWRKFTELEVVSTGPPPCETLYVCIAQTRRERGSEESIKSVWI